MEKTNFSEFNENNKNVLTEEEKGNFEEKQDLNLSLQEEAFFKEKENKRPTRSSKRKATRKNLKEESIISNEECSKLLNSNTKVTKQEKGNLKKKNLEKACINNVPMAKSGLSDTIEILEKPIQYEKETKCADKQLMQEEKENKNSLFKQMESEKPENQNNKSLISINFNKEDKIINNACNENSELTAPSKSFSFSQIGNNNKQITNTVNSNPNVDTVSKNFIFNLNGLTNKNNITNNNLSITSLSANSSNNNPPSQLGISSLKNKLSLKVVIPALDKKIPNDLNTETLSVKENKENLRNIHNLKENVNN